MARIRIGISGWRYPGWRGSFYPAGLPQRAELAYVAARMDTVEINGSFYALQRPASYLSWREQTPEGFCFAVKGGRFITHLKRLAGVDAALANFFASGVLALGRKLGPILWQLPPTLGYDADRLAGFLARLPRTTVDAAALAERHDARLSPDRVWTRPGGRRRIRHAVEVRHPSYRTPEFVRLLRAHRVGLVVSGGAWPLLEDVTADFVYVRLHGSEQLYTSGYTPAALDAWAARLAAWCAGGAPTGARTVLPTTPRPAGRDVFCYFDNDAKVRAPYDAMALAERFPGLRARLVP